MATLAWLAVIALSALVVGVEVWWMRRERELIAPVPIAFAAIGFFVIPRALFLLAFNRAPLTSGGLSPSDRDALIAQTVLTGLVASVGFLLGHRAERAARAGAELNVDIPTPDRQRALWVGGAAAFVGATVIVYLFSVIGNVGYAMGHQYKVNQLLEGKQSLFQLARLVVAAVVLLLVHPRTGRTRWWIWVLAVFTTITFLPFGSRALVLLSAASPIALYHLTVRRVKLRWMLAAGAVTGCVLFVLGFARLLTGKRLEQAAVVFYRQPGAAMQFAFNAVGELKIFDATSIVVRDVPRVIPYNYGVTFARVPWMIVPRRLWHEKPVTFGQMIVERYLPSLHTAYPPMAIGELFAAGGWLGVLVGFVVLGWLSRVVWEWHLRHAGTGNASLYLLFCFFVFDFVRVGDPSRTMWFFMIGAGMTAAMFIVAAPWSPSSELSPQPA